MEQARQIVIGGLKGYERLLSLSRDTGNPRWKPLHLAAGYNSRNRRNAKMRTKTNWYKGKPEVEQPRNARRELAATKFSIHREDKQEAGSSQQEGRSSQQEEQSSQEEGRGASKSQEELPGGSRQDTTLAAPGKSSRKATQGAGKNTRNKKRGPCRGTITLGGLNKMRKAKKRRAKSRLRKRLGQHNVQVKKTTGKRAGPPPPTRSVMFVDNTAGGILAKRFKQAEEEAGEVT